MLFSKSGFTDMMIRKARSDGIELISGEALNDL